MIKPLSNNIFLWSFNQVNNIMELTLHSTEFQLTAPVIPSAAPDLRIASRDLPLSFISPLLLRRWGCMLVVIHWSPWFVTCVILPESVYTSILYMCRSRAVELKAEKKKKNEKEKKKGGENCILNWSDSKLKLVSHCCRTDEKL